MNLILVPKTNFDQLWAGEYLSDVLRPSDHILLFHFSENHEYDLISFDYEEDIIRPFLTYGIAKERIKIITPYVDDEENIQYTLEQDYDVIGFVGNDAYQAMLYLDDYGIKEKIQSFEGTLLFVGEIGYVAGDVVQDEIEGLGLLDELQMDINYRYDEDHIARVIRLLEMGHSKVVLIPEEGGLLSINHYYDTFGRATVVGEDDLDSLYETFHNSL
ncbi:MAG: hypothetical protein IKE51_02095 [Solobacterium sp.]|nr:hypothetical protein [Solobacterium sp.]